MIQLFAQLALQHFSVVVFWKAVDEAILAWPLESRDALQTERVEFFFAHLVCRLPDNECNNLLPPFGMRPTDKFAFDVPDPTKIIPEEEVPVQPVGRLVLDR